MLKLDKLVSFANRIVRFRDTKRGESHLEFKNTKAIRFSSVFQPNGSSIKVVGHEKKESAAVAWCRKAF
jgi:hypothetical protein